MCHDWPRIGMILMFPVLIFLFCNPGALPQTEMDLTVAPQRIADLQQQGRYPEAITAAKKSLSAAHTTFSESDRRRIQIIKALATGQAGSGNVSCAASTFDDNIKKLESHNGSKAAVAQLQIPLASLYGLLGKKTEAENCASAAVAAHEASPDNPSLAEALVTLEMQKAALGKTDEQLSLLKRALRVLDRTPSVPVRRMVLERLSTYYETAGEPETAAGYRNQAQQLGTGTPLDNYADARKAGHSCPPPWRL